MTFIAKQFETKELVQIWNAGSPKPVKKFADRKSAERRVSKLIEDGGDTLVQKIINSTSITGEVEIKLSEMFIMTSKKKGKGGKATKPKAEKVERGDGKYNRTNPKFETDTEKQAYVESQYQTKTDRFPGRKSQFAKKYLVLVKEISCPFREGTVVENSFNLIAQTPYIPYEDFRMAGGRNTDLKAMVDRGIVKAVNKAPK